MIKGSHCASFFVAYIKSFCNFISKKYASICNINDKTILIHRNERQKIESVLI